MTHANIIAYAHYPAYLRSLVKVISRIERHVPVRRLILVSTMPAEVVRAELGRLRVAASSTEIVNHDNTGWEFGGYQRGLDYLRHGWVAGDSVVVLNDTVGRHSVLTMGMLKAFVAGLALAQKDARPVLVGEVDAAVSGCAVRDLDASTWARTCLFATNEAGLRCLEWTLDVPALSDGMSLSDGPKLAFGPHVSGTLANAINIWLLGSPDGRPRHRRVGFDRSALLSKALSILNERYLSARTIAAGGRLLNIYPCTWHGYIAYRLARKWNNSMTSLLSVR